MACLPWSVADRRKHAAPRLLTSSCQQRALPMHPSFATSASACGSVGMIEHLFAPLAGVGEFVLRLTIGLVFWPHGWQKLKGPAGFAGFLRQLKVPAPLLAAWVVALLESVGAILLILGLATRLVAFGLAIDIVKVGMAKAPFASTQQVQGWEFEFALMGTSLALVFTGAGRVSIDALL